MTMKDSRPVPAVVRMELRDSRHTAEDLISLSVSMLQKGLILGEPRELRRLPQTPEILELVCTFTDKSAADKWLQNDFIKRCHGKIFRKLLKHRPTLIRYRDVILDVDDVKVCACKTKPRAYLLQGRALDELGSLLCGECMNYIPQYRIPAKLNSIETFARLHSNIYDLWLASGTLEKWAERQLDDYNSDLNKDARKVIREVTQYYRRPAYYMIWAEEYDEKMSCPHCGNKGHRSPWRKPTRICKRCKLAFGY
jgi:predicted  nucleic acid-binding Zn ribbon protein